MVESSSSAAGATTKEEPSISSSSSASSKWKLKLDKKLRGLADSASAESIQTVSIYIGFNRKYSNEIATCLYDALVLNTKTSNNGQQRQWLFWQIIHELLLANHTNPSKYDKYFDLRTTLGDITVIPAIKFLGNNVTKDKLEPLLKEWDEHNVFSSPTLVSQIRRMLVSSNSTAATTKEEDTVMTPAETATTQKSLSSKDETKKVDDSSKHAAATATTKSNDNDAPSTPTTTKAVVNNNINESPFTEKAQRRRSSLGSLSGDIEYDFESKNVPQGKVDSREFLDPCKAIATLQIARDLRNDTAVQLSSLLSTMPKDIQEVCSSKNKNNKKSSDDDDDNKEGKKDELLSKETIHDYSMRIPSKILDFDIDEQIQTIQTFQELIRQQMTAREKLIHLLLKSRCHFGSEPAAKYFIELQSMMDQLQRRKQLLGDALELEGLDNELDNTDFDKEIQELQPLSWYNKGGGDGGEATTTPDGNKSNNNNDGSSNKKARLK